MSDFLNWSPISLGRWFGTRIRLHTTLILFLLIVLALATARSVGEGSAWELALVSVWVGLLLAALLAHELAHVLAGWLLDVECEPVNVWPLGNLVWSQGGSRPREHPLVTVAGPLASGMLFLMTVIALHMFTTARFNLNPFGDSGVPGSPRSAGGMLAVPLSREWTLGWFAYLNYILVLVNLIPALPFDMGRLLRGAVPGGVLLLRETPYIFWAAKGSALLLLGLGLGRIVVSHRLDGVVVIGLALVVEVLARLEMRELEDREYDDEGLFGYDFSEGYTSLEASPARVRRRRENVIERWRRRRMETRRLRQVAQALADEKRMDEILEKLHREGKAGLTAGEQRFLLSYSARLRQRTRSRE